MNYKKLLFAALAFLMITATISCKNEDEPFKDALSNTTWVGKIDEDDIAIQFGEDTKVTVFNGGLNAPANSQFPGTYTYSNGIVLFTVTTPANAAIKYSFAGTLNANKIDGTWGNDNSTTDGGTFSVTKK